MKLTHWLKNTSREERNRVAREAHTSVSYLYQLAGGHKTASAQKAARISTATDGAVSRLEILYPNECVEQSA